jgi:ribosomal protein L40E
MPEAIGDLLRCPSCGASNPAHATWCGQCLRRFGKDAPSDATPARSTPGRLVVHTGEGGEQVWTCPACDAENPLEADACARCGSAFTSFFAGPAEHLAPRTSPAVALASSAVLPGAGHWLCRETAPAIARAVLYVWSVGISILLLARPPKAGRAFVRSIGACFVLSALAIWLLSMLETTRLVSGDRRPLIPPKALTWFTAGMSSLLIIGLLGAVLAGR